MTKYQFLLKKKNRPDDQLFSKTIHTRTRV